MENFAGESDTPMNLMSTTTEAYSGAIAKPFTTSSGFTAVALVTLITFTILGNLLVLITIATDRNLRTLESNYLLFSLAIADLFVGLLVMPFGAVQIITGQWLLGATWCEIWTFVDITSCSTSILHLLSIAIDRHLSVSLKRLKWSAKKNTQSIYIMIACSWLIAAFVAACPLLGWKDDGFLDRISQKVCIVSQSLSFLFFGITVTFYMPLFLILLFYWRIWLAVRARHERRKQKAGIALEGPNNTKSSDRTPQSSDAELSCDRDSGNASTEGISLGSTTIGTPSEADRNKAIESSKRSRRAAKTLAIITGAFFICWTPRFLMLPIVVLCGESCNVDPRWADFTQWLGFSNSMLNPIIYTIFSADFRTAFRKTLKSLKGTT